MKKTLIALAALAAVGSSFAQSSVTLYGRMDMGFATNKLTSVSTANVTTTTKTTSLVGAEGSKTTNRFGVRGSEDLGGGLKLNFNVETKMFADPTNKNGDQTFGGTRTYILQMAGSFGAVTVGTYSGNSIDNLRSYSVSAAGVAGGDHANVVMGDSRGAATRSTNSIGYRSPNFGGMTFGLGTSNEKSVVTTAGVDNTTKSSGYMGDVTYSAGPLAMMLAVAQAKSFVTATTDYKVSDVGFAASYDLGMAVPYFLVEKSTMKVPAETKSTVYEIGSKFPMGALTPYITLSRGKIQTATQEDKTTAYQIGTTYDLSKRSYVYAAIGGEKQKNNLTVANTKKTGAALGLVHNF
jgi:predicted porin